VVVKLLKFADDTKVVSKVGPEEEEWRKCLNVLGENCCFAQTSRLQE